MNFIIEVIKKNPTSKVVAYVVRVSNGAPIAIVDTLDAVKVLIQEQVDKALSSVDDAK